MAFFQLVMSARNLAKAQEDYHDEKLKSIEISKGGKPHYTLRQRIRIKKIMLRIKMREFFKNCLRLPEDTWLQQKMESFKTDGTFENYILKSMIGFLGGIFLTYIFFMFFVFQLNFTLSSATLLCSIFGIILTIGLAFSYRVRCVVFLLLPQFFSKRGRQALMAYAFILALTGPAKNTLHNIGVLSESLACGQEQLKEAVKTIVDLVKQPFYALRDAVAGIIKTVKIVANRIKQALLAIKRMVLSIIKVITAVFEWLGSVVSICNKKLGTPFERCEKVFDGAVGDCYAKLGPWFGGVCNLAYVVGALCYIVKPLDFICILVSFVSDAIVGAIRKKIKKFSKHMKAMFYVKVDFSHSFHFESNKSRTLEDVATGIVTEIRSRTDKFLTLFDWMSFATSFFVLFMLLRVIHYRHKWLTNERFDNQYLTQDLRQIDLIRAKQDKETVLPLNPREKSKYIPLTSITLIRVEKIHLTKSAVFLSLTTFKLCIHMMVDYSLYWILSTIRYHGRFETKVQQVNSVGMYVSGDGYLAQLYRSIIKAFSPSDSNIEVDTLPCLPDPIPPDFDRYAQIVSLIVICWIMTVFEPYGLRLRQVVMGYYHPERAKQRAVWLYNHIIRSRGSFIKYARRQLRRKFGMNGDKAIENITLKERFMAICPILHKLFPQKQTMCLLCGSPQRDDQLPHFKCPSPGCIGIFCPECFADLQNLCTICRSPIEYGDMSDISEERDSSEDEPIRIFKKSESVEKPTEETEETEEMTTEVSPLDVEKGETPTTPPTTGDKPVEMSENISTDSSEYSQSYQEEPPDRILPVDRPVYRDIEAQKVRDDVTIQIFNEPLIGDSDDSSGEPASCFVLRAHRKLTTRVKPSCPCREDSSSLEDDSGDSGSSCESTEEIEEEEVLHIEVEDDSGTRALLGAGGSGLLRRKRGRVQRIVDALNRVSFIKNRASKDKGRTPGKRGSITQRVIKMLQSKDTTACMPCQRRRRSRSDGEHLGEDSSDYLPRKERKMRFKRSKSHPQEVHEHHGEDIYSLDWDSHRERGGTDEPSALSHPMAGNTQYYEVDETTSPDQKEEPKVRRKKTAKTKNVRKDERRQFTSAEMYETRGARSKKPKRILKKFPLIEEETEITETDGDQELPIVEEEKTEESPMTEDEKTGELPIIEDEKTDEEEEGSGELEEAGSLESLTSDSPPEKQRRGIFSEYSKRFRKRKRKCKKCKKGRDKTELTEQKNMSLVEATQTSVKDNVTPAIYPQAPVCPMIIPVPYWFPPPPVCPGQPPGCPGQPPICPGQSPICPGQPPVCPGQPPVCPGRPPICPGRLYNVEEWLRCNDLNNQQDDYFEDRNEIEECNCEYTCGDYEPEPEEDPRQCPQCHHQEDRLPVMRRFLPGCPHHEVVQECRGHGRRESSITRVHPRFVACQEIQTDPTSLPNVLSQQPPKIPKGGEALPYQSTEVFPQLVAEYKKKTIPQVEAPNAPARDESNEETPLIAHDSKELIQIYPEPSAGPSRAVPKFKGKFTSKIKTNNLRRRKDKRWSESSSPVESHRNMSGAESSDDETTR